jgi:hypothetical protein
MLATRIVSGSIFRPPPYPDGVSIDETAIWTVDNTGKLAANWENGDHTNVPVSCAYNAAEDNIVLVGDITDFCSQNPGYEPVV